MKKTRTAKPRASRLDKLTAATLQDFAHHSTSDIVRQRGLITAARDAADSEILELSTKIAAARDRRGKLDATLMGLGLVIGKR